MDRHQELKRNWETFIAMVQKTTSVNDEATAVLVKRYTDQNVEIINDVLVSSIEQLQRLQKVKSMNDIICTQARLTDEIGKKLMHIAKKFFNESLNNVSDYNAWLKTHCDLAD